MNKKTIQNLSNLRRSTHLMLSDVSHILGIDTANLSRFEAGKSYPKAFVGYHVLFNLSIQNNIRQAFAGGYKELSDRAFQLLEILQTKSKTTRNRLRIEGVNKIIDQLMQLEQAYGK